MKRKEISLSRILALALLVLMFFTVSFGVLDNFKLNKTQSYLQDNGLFMGILTIGGHQLKVLQDDGTGTKKECTKISLGTDAITTDKQHDVLGVYIQNEDQGINAVECYVRWKFIATIDGVGEININEYCKTSSVDAFIDRNDNYFYYINSDYSMKTLPAGSSICLFDKMLFEGEYDSATKTYGSIIDKYFSGSNFKLTLVVEASNDEWEVPAPTARFVLNDGTQDIIVYSSLEFEENTTVPSPEITVDGVTTSYATIIEDGTTYYFEGWQRESGGLYKSGDTVLLQEYDVFNAVYSRSGNLISQATLNYTSNEDGTYTINSVNADLIEDGNLVIQNPSDDQLLTIIEDGAAQGNLTITQISAQNSSITEIGANAFRTCYNLKTVTLPDTVEKIGDYAFSGCTSLKNITFPANLKSIGTYAFNNSKIEELILPEGLEDIGTYTFVRNSVLKTVKIPTTLQALDSGAFAHCVALETVYIPATVTSINGYAFGGCVSLTNFIVDEANQNYSVDEPINGSPILYNKEKTTIVSYSSVSGVWTVPQYITKIGSWAVGHNPYITGVVLHSNVYSVCGFMGCPNLVSFTVAEGNSYHKEVTNSQKLYNASGNTMYAHPSASGDVVVDEAGVTIVSHDAYDFNNNITSIVFAGDVTMIRTACQDCRNLESVTIGANVRYITKGSFITYSAKFTSITFVNTDGWHVTTNSNYTGGTDISAELAEDSYATLIKYQTYYWYRVVA